MNNLTRFGAAFCLLHLLFAPCRGGVCAEESRTGTVQVQITEAGTGKPLPCRLTITDKKGNLAPITAEKTVGIALRPGVLYTANGAARFTLPQGAYTLYATRGPAYGLAQRPFAVVAQPQTLRLALEKEVDTSGYVGCDTHIHTLTDSGHGDCTIAERMVTLAGEEVQLPIATDHNVHIDYRPRMQSAGTQSRFTPVIGNEVTTSVGHFNIFPVRQGSAPPPFQSQNRAQILKGIRAVLGVQVVILNHPDDTHAGFRASDPARFHPLSGESLDGNPWDFNGIEVINSGALRSDYMQPYRDWFALLNRGHRIAGIGASDSHDVDRFLVGQARTYILSSAKSADKIDVEEACRNLRDGKALVSMGLLTEMWAEDRFRSGELATLSGDALHLRVRVRGPRWIDADRVEIFANGEKIASRPLLPRKDSVVKADISLTLPRPRQDVWLVAIATGPGVTAPYWPLRRPYQPDRADWEPRVIGSTGAIWIDSDGDGRYSSPFAYAQRLIQAQGTEPDRLVPALAAYDAATAVQAASLCRAQGVDLFSAAFEQAINAAAPATRQGIVAYRVHLPSKAP